MKKAGLFPVLGNWYNPSKRGKLNKSIFRHILLEFIWDYLNMTYPFPDFATSQGRTEGRAGRAAAWSA